MRAGRRDRKIRIDRLVATKDDVGAEVQSWQRLCDMWVEYLPVNGREFIAAQQVVGESTVRLRGPFDARVTLRHRVVMGDKNFDIQNIAEIGRGAGMELVCKLIDEN